MMCLQCESVLDMEKVLVASTHLCSMNFVLFANFLLTPLSAVFPPEPQSR